jgi:hypothetical protein
MLNAMVFNGLPKELTMMPDNTRSIPMTANLIPRTFITSSCSVNDLIAPSLRRCGLCSSAFLSLLSSLRAAARTFRVFRPDNPGEPGNGIGLETVVAFGYTGFLLHHSSSLLGFSIELVPRGG